ncbi:hypothetical protein [Mycobacterium sp. Marseille-P9652]|uniref:hypothetical protein n=1 Tax=Mycobacterium sp. Marseille-P9652 TaxID=2654950 RepID=UPI0012E90294|nr:hypothetical protein [Mycobacterium sp. Marseille-P9652]
MQALRVDTAGVRAMAARWAASASELGATSAPAGLGAPGHASAAAVEAAHIDVAAFTESLAARVAGRSTNVGVADAGYQANEAGAALEMAAVAPRGISV